MDAFQLEDRIYCILVLITAAALVVFVVVVVQNC